MLLGRSHIFCTFAIHCPLLEIYSYASATYLTTNMRFQMFGTQRITECMENFLMCVTGAFQTQLPENFCIALSAGFVNLSSPDFLTVFCSFLFDNLGTVEILPRIQCKTSKNYATNIQKSYPHLYSISFFVGLFFLLLFFFKVIFCQDQQHVWSCKR